MHQVTVLVFVEFVQVLEPENQKIQKYLEEIQPFILLEIKQSFKNKNPKNLISTFDLT